MNLDALVTESIETYHKSPALSASGMKLLLVSPLHYKSRYIDGIALEPGEEEELSIVDDPTPAQRFGQLFHKFILEPMEFKGRFKVQPVFAGTGMRDRKEAWLGALPKDAIVVKQEELDQFMGMAKSLQSHRYASNLLTGGHREKSCYFDVPLLTGGVIACRTRPDIIHEDGTIVELKTALDASYNAFQRAVENNGYFTQAAVQVDGVTKATGLNVKTHVWIGVEKKPPYAVGVYPIDEEYLGDGRKEYSRACGILAHAKASGVWSGYNGDEPLNMIRPPWKVYG